jgi:hypothetical protein
VREFCRSVTGLDRVEACGNNFFGVRLGSDGFGDLRFSIFEFRFLIECGAFMGASGAWKCRGLEVVLTDNLVLAGASRC